MDTRAAESLKFGSVASSTAPGDERSESVARSNVRSSDTSQNYSQTYSEGEEGVEMQDANGNESDEYDEYGERHKKYDEENGDEELEIQELGSDPYSGGHGAYHVSHERDSGLQDYAVQQYNEGGRKTTDDGWRTLCILCSCLSCVALIAMSIGLGKAATTDSAAPPAEEVVLTNPPSASPTFSPTNPPEDFTWCYESDESMALENDRYALIRSVLVDSTISTDDDFSDDASYQRKSLCWLSFGDRLELDASDPFLEQRYALATIFYGLNEPNKMLSEGWLSGRPECEWKPLVECDDRTDTRVTRLDLHGNELFGALPKEMAVLKDVTYLDLSTNQLDGDVSLVIGDWTHLEELRLSSNIFGSIPSALNAWKALKYFDISSNEVQGPIPDSLSSSTELVYLDIAANDFSGTISSQFGNLTSLETFYTHSNSLEGTMPKAVCDLRSGALKQLSVDCKPPTPEVECDLTCCSVCNDYDVDRNPWDRY